jgi:hypothetical protein
MLFFTRNWFPYIIPVMDMFLLRQLTQRLLKDFLLKEKNYVSADRFSKLNALVIFTSCPTDVHRRLRPHCVSVHKTLMEEGDVSF